MKVQILAILYKWDDGIKVFRYLLDKNDVWY